jgi:predicted dithiol-disulfide oxidoreductase (DUF899 family)
MQNHTVVSRREWIAARKALLAKEKEFTRWRDELSKARRELPWVRVEKEYLFDGPDGNETLAQLFDNRHQLIVYHFMFDPTWETGCKSCSFWADNIDPNVVHLKHRDITPVVVSRAPYPKLAAFRARMGWRFKWVSSFGNDFNYDYHVSFAPEAIASGNASYNYRPRPLTDKLLELPGISVFFKVDSGQMFHTYSCYARGLDMMNAAYHYLDLVPKGRDEVDAHPQAWVRYRDSYEDSAR